MVRIAVAALMLLCSLLGWSARGWAADPEDRIPDPEIIKGKALEPAEGDSELRKLSKARYNAALQEVKVRYQGFLAGRKEDTLDRLHAAARRLTAAEMALYDKPADQARIQEKYVQVTEQLLKIVKASYEAGRMSVADLEEARFVNLDAQIKLQTLRQQK
jgi:hypothetical protein